MLTADSSIFFTGVYFPEPSSIGFGGVHGLRKPQKERCFLFFLLFEKTLRNFHSNPSIEYQFVGTELIFLSLNSGPTGL